MTETGLREAYLAWTRRGKHAAVQAASASPWWASGPSPAGEVRYLFIAVGAASIAMGRSHRTRDTAARPIAREALIALSWRLVTFALAPVAIGAVLAMMTRSVIDFYLLLLVTLVGLGMLYPRFDQWAFWASPPEAGVE